MYEYHRNSYQIIVDIELLLLLLDVLAALAQGLMDLGLDLRGGLLDVHSLGSKQGRVGRRDA
jgi:hypothetical protein